MLRIARGLALNPAQRWGRRGAGTCWGARGDSTADGLGFAGIGENCSAGGGGMEIVSGTLADFYFYAILQETWKPY